MSESDISEVKADLFHTKGLLAIAKLDNERLQREIYGLRAELRKRDKEMEDRWLLLGDNAHLRALMSEIELEMQKKDQEAAECRARAEKAERGIRNLQKWLEITGGKGGSKHKIEDFY